MLMQNREIRQLAAIREKKHSVLFPSEVHVTGFFPDRTGREAAGEVLSSIPR